jgi:large subunit ribosomal protein L24
VFVTKGRDRGRTGQVRKVIPSDGRVIVTGVNIVKRHLKPRSSGGQQKPGGIIEREAPIAWANVALVCTACGQPTRIGFRAQADGRKVRFCKRCNSNLD